MKLLHLTLICSFSAFGVTHKNLNFSDPDFSVPKVTLDIPLETNLINLHLLLPNETMLAQAFKEASKEELDSLETPIWVDDIRLKGKSSNGQKRF